MRSLGGRGVRLHSFQFTRQDPFPHCAHIILIMTSCKTLFKTVGNYDDVIKHAFDLRGGNRRKADKQATAEKGSIVR